MFQVVFLPPVVRSTSCANVEKSEACWAMFCALWLVRFASVVVAWTSFLLCLAGPGAVLFWCRRSVGGWLDECGCVAEVLRWLLELLLIVFVLSFVFADFVKVFGSIAWCFPGSCCMESLYVAFWIS